MRSNNSQPTFITNNTNAESKPYTKPRLTIAGNLEELTQGFSGSIPDEQGGHTKRNPFQG